MCLTKLKEQLSGQIPLIEKVALSLRSAIRDEVTKQQWPHLPSSQEETNTKILYSVKRFLSCILTGEHTTSDVSERVRWLLSSLGQDLVYTVTCGKYKPPKHILLAAAVKALTGNVELLQALNRLGHCVSYSQVEENETALCMRKLAASAGNKVVLPEETFPFLFTTMAWDNIDMLEETLTGAGTSHRVNGIIIQPRVYGPHQKPQQIPAMKKQKLRSIVVDDLNLPVYNSGDRTGPGLLLTAPEDTDHAHDTAFAKNLLWVLMRQAEQANQDVCSWTGFNILSRKGLEVNSDKIGYLPTINAPATQLATCAEILEKSKDVMKQLNLETIVLVFDQALFAKVAEVMWKHKERYRGIILRMGTFHTICNLLSILGKRFQDAGLRDVCIESNIIAEGSVAAVMEGRQYNRAVRVHKCVYEALMRIAYRGFPEWLADNHPDKKAHLQQCLELISDLHAEMNSTSYQETVVHPTFTSVAELFQEYLDHLRHHNGPLSSFWMSYVDIVESILLGLLRAAREGDWNLHMFAIQEMIVVLRI